MGTQTSAAEIARARALLGAEVRESDFQAEVIKAAQLLKWRCYHTFDSRKSAGGFPDLTMVRGTRLIMAELKKQNADATQDQQAWLDDLAKVETLETFLWRPSDWPAVEETLR